jgi:diguanylate cyclase (GGDEF)-like protein
LPPFHFRSAVRLTIDWPGEHYQLRNLVGIRLEAAVKVAGKLVNLLSQVYPIGPLMLHISASIGVSEYPYSGASIVELLASADAAMYKAKAAGRRRVAW